MACHSMKTSKGYPFSLVPDADQRRLSKMVAPDQAGTRWRRRECSDAWIIDRVRTLGTVTVCGPSKLPLKLSSESHLFPMSAIAPDDISGSGDSVAFGGVIPNANGHVPMEGACRGGTSCFQRVAHTELKLSANSVTDTRASMLRNRRGERRPILLQLDR